MLKKVVRWTREVNPSQPLTVGLWKGDPELWGTPEKMRPLERFMVENSDIISFHSYDNPKVTQIKIKELKKYNRPIICTEYLARSFGSTFDSILPLFKENEIHAINWGFVAGKTNTIFPWSSWTTPLTLCLKFGIMIYIKDKKSIFKRRNYFFKNNFKE